jgi:hypothetical protein
MYWLSGAESEKFVKSVLDACEKMEREGPNPIKKLGVNISEKKKESLITPVE